MNFENVDDFLKQLLSASDTSEKKECEMFGFVKPANINDEMYEREECANAVIECVREGFRDFVDLKGGKVDKRKHPIHAVLGGPGSGKTALLVYLFECMKNSDWKEFFSRVIGIFIDYSDVGGLDSVSKKDSPTIEPDTDIEMDGSSLEVNR